MSSQAPKTEVGEVNESTILDAVKKWRKAKTRSIVAWIAVGLWLPCALMVDWSVWIWVLVVMLPLITAWLLTEHVEGCAEKLDQLTKDTNAKLAAAALHRSKAIGGAVGERVWNSILVLSGDVAWLVGVGIFLVYAFNPIFGTELFVALGITRTCTSRIRTRPIQA